MDLSSIRIAITAATAVLGMSNAQTPARGAPDTAAVLMHDFRAITTPRGLILLLDLDEMKVDGNLRALHFYSAGATAGSYYRADVEIDCANRLERINATAVMAPEATEFSAPSGYPNEWGKADNDPTGTQITDLSCAPLAERDRYTARIFEQDWRSALQNASKR